VDPVTWKDVRELIPPDSLKKIEGMEIDGRFELPEIEIETRAASEKSFVSGRLAFSDVLLKAPDAPLGFSRGKGNVRFSPGTIVLEDGEGLLGKDAVNFSARIEGEATKRMDLSVASRLDAQNLSRLLPEGSEFALERGVIALDLSTSGDLPIQLERLPAIRGSIRLEDIAGTYGHLPVAGKGKLRFLGAGATVEELKGTLGASDFSVTGTVPDLRNPKLDFSLLSRTLDLNELFPESEREETAPSSAKEQEGKAVGIPASGSIHVEKLRMKKMEMTNLRGRVDVGLDGIALNEIRADAHGGTVKGDLRLLPAEDGRTWTYAGHLDLDGIGVGPVLSSWTKLAGRIEGRTDGQIDLSGQTAPGSDPARDLSLDAWLKVRDGAFINMRGLDELGKALRIKEAIGERWPFRDLWAVIVMREGRLGVDTLRVFQKQAEWKLAGSIGLDGSLDIRGTMFAQPSYITLPPEAQMVAPYLQNEKGEIPIDFMIAGLLKSPNVTLDWTAILSRATEKAKQEEPGKLKDLIKETLKDPDTLDKLKKLWGGGR
jgi:hypothetical protein